MDLKRCPWCGTEDKIYLDYHDVEWGTPIFDDRLLFEFLCLEGMQAGLSWLTILRKRERFRVVFDNFVAEKIVRYKSAKIATLLQDPGIIRHPGKIAAIQTNAQIFLKVREQYSSFADYLWRFVDGRPIQNHFKQMDKVPASTAISEQMSKTLKKDGFKFVGSTICYAFMQAVGMTNDHLTSCYRYAEIKAF